jgi:anti-anti-sigma factor
MRSEALDIIIESRGRTLWLTLSGPFLREQVPNIREKIAGLVDVGNRDLVIDMEQVSEVDESALPMFLSLLNLVRGKGGELRFVFRNQAVSQAFGAYRNIFPIFVDREALRYRGFLGLLRLRGKLLRRKTGVRLSRPVAIFLLFIIAGWFLSLALVIHGQGKRLAAQEDEIRQLTTWRDQTLIEFNQLREKLQPLEQLGIVEDAPAKGAP